MRVIDTKDTLLQLMDTEIDEAFGIVLFGKLYQEASAYVERGRYGLRLRLLDSIFAPEVLDREWDSNATTALYVNHPEGDMEPRKHDLRNLEATPKGTELYIVCENECVKWEDWS